MPGWPPAAITLPVSPDLRLVAPLFQGVNLELADPLINNSHWGWPVSWEAALLILQGKTDGFWIHVQDTQFRPKGVQIGTKSAANVVGLDTEAFGPHDTNLAAGGLIWRVNVHGSDWQAPAGRYRDWYYQAFNLEPRVNARKEWTHDIHLAGCWLDTNPDVLDALAQKIEPKKVLLHLAQRATTATTRTTPLHALRCGPKLPRQSQRHGLPCHAALQRHRHGPNPPHLSGRARLHLPQPRQNPGRLGMG